MIIDIFRKNNGYLESKDLGRKRSLYYELNRLVESAEVACLRKGLYKHHVLASLDHWQEVSLIYSKAIICMHSAALYYDLTTYVPAEMHLAIGRKSRIKIGNHPPVKIYYWMDKYFTQHALNINGVHIYSIERTLCDIIRLESQNDLGMVKEASRAYLQHKDSNMNTLLKIAKEIDAYNKVSNFFEILI